MLVDAYTNICERRFPLKNHVSESRTNPFGTKESLELQASARLLLASKI